MDERRMRRELLEISGGKHICVTCTHLPSHSGAAEMSTMTPHPCEQFCQGARETRYGSGNTAIYSDGTVTDDNGGGYWVLRCPRYETDEAWCALLGVEIID